VGDKEVLRDILIRLLSDVEEGRYRGACDSDVAEMRCMAAAAAVFPLEKSIELATQARAMVAEIPANERDTTELLFLAKCSNVLGNCHFYSGDLEAAAEHFQESWQIFHDLLGEVHPMSLGRMVNLSAVLGKLSRVDEALTLLHRLEELGLAELGDEHITMGKVALELALCYQAKADFPRALERFDQALQIRKLNLGPAHKRVANALFLRGGCREQTSDAKGAFADFSRALDIYASVGATRVCGNTCSIEDLRCRVSDLEKLASEAP